MNTNHFANLLKAIACLTLAFLLTSPATAQDACDDGVREQFLADVNDGATEDELEEKYGYCRTDGTADTEAVIEKARAAAQEGDKFKIVLNSNTLWENMTGCGYNPQSETVACDVQISQPFGYGGFGPRPAGSDQNVLFCGDCDGNGTIDFAVPGVVHVNDQNPALPGALPIFHMAHATTFGTPACAVKNGVTGTMITILSWAVPPAGCFSVPIFGNRIVESIRLDP